MSSDDSRPPYDQHDKQSIYHYAIDLKGSTLREKTAAKAIDDIRRNKGSFGGAVESCCFMLDLNSDSAPDFKEAGLELKTTPLKRNKDGSLSAKVEHWGHVQNAACRFLCVKRSSMRPS